LADLLFCFLVADDFLNYPGSGVSFYIRNGERPAAPLFHFGMTHYLVQFVIPAFHKQIRFYRLDDFDGGFRVKNHDKVHAIERGQHVGAVVLVEKRSARPLAS